MLNNIKSERVRKGFTQDALGEHLGVDVSTIRRWERDGADVPSGMAIRMSSLFGCTIDYLFGLTEERTKTSVL